MIDSFYMNGDFWTVRFVNPTNRILVDRTGTLTVGVTNPVDRTVYLSNALRGNFLIRVTLHELAHAMMISYGYLEQIHLYCKNRYWIDMEEFIANLIADRAYEIFERAYDIVGDQAIRFVPYGMERLVA